MYEGFKESFHQMSTPEYRNYQMNGSLLEPFFGYTIINYLFRKSIIHHSNQGQFPSSAGPPFVLMMFVSMLYI